MTSVLFCRFVYLIPDELLEMKKIVEPLISSHCSGVSKLRKIISFFWRVPGWVPSRFDSSFGVFEYNIATLKRSIL